MTFRRVHKNRIGSSIVAGCLFVGRAFGGLDGLGGLHVSRHRSRPHRSPPSSTLTTLDRGLSKKTLLAFCGAVTGPLQRSSSLFG